ETIRTSVRRRTCCHCGLLRRRCKPHKKVTRVGECCTMSLSKGISFLAYAWGWHSERTRISSCVQFGPLTKFARLQYLLASTQNKSCNSLSLTGLDAAISSAWVQSLAIS